jgi:hypothetical protein
MSKAKKWTLMLTGLCAISIAIAFVLGMVALEERFRRTHCTHNLKALSLAMAMYSDAHTGHFPDRWDQLKEQLATARESDWSVLLCPNDARF